MHTPLSVAVVMRPPFRTERERVGHPLSQGVGGQKGLDHPPLAQAGVARTCPRLQDKGICGHHN
jgi:hypothetical protein